MPLAVPAIGRNDVAATATAPDKAQVAELLQRSLTTIRYALGHRQAGVTIDDRTRMLAASLADAIHNLPVWMTGTGFTDDTARRDFTVATGLLDELETHIRTHPPAILSSKRPAAPRRLLLARWLGR